MKVVLVSLTNILNKRHINNDPMNAIIHGLLLEEKIDCVSLYNCTLYETIQAIMTLQPTYIGINIPFSVDFEKVSKFMLEIKRKVPNCILIGYGVYVSACCEQLVTSTIYNHFDVLIKGQPEKTFFEIVTNQSYKREENEEIKVMQGIELEDVDSLPFSHNPERNEVSMRISWGCKFNCFFCQEKAISQKYKYRSVESVVEELIYLYEQSDKSIDMWILFADLDFLAVSGSDKTWIPRFVHQVKENQLKFKFLIQTRANWIDEENIRLLKTIGLNAIAIGIETGSNRVIRLYNKGFNDISYNIQAIQTLIKLGVPYKMNFIMYEPSTTMDDIRQNIDYFFKSGYPKGVTPSHPPASFFDKLVLFQGTRAYEYYKNQKDVQLKIIKNQVVYEFKDKDVALFYLYVKEWRNKVKFLNQVYYFLLNQTYASSNYIQDSKIRNNLLLNLMLVKHKFMTIDMNFLNALSYADFKNETVARHIVDMYYLKTKEIEEKLLALKNKYVGEDVEITLISNELNTRGFHGQMKEILDDYNLDKA